MVNDSAHSKLDQFGGAVVESNKEATFDALVREIGHT